MNYFKMILRNITVMLICILSIPDIQAGQGNANLNFEDLSELQEYKGFIDFYYSEQEDRVYLLVDKLNLEFLYVNSLSAGVGSNDIGLDRGQIGDQRVVMFSKRGNKLLLVQPNYQYRAYSSNPDEQKAVNEAFARSVLWGFTILDEADGKLIVDATDFFMQDMHGVIESLKSSGQGNYAVNLSRSAFNTERIKNFPKNSEFDVLLTFTGKAEGEYIKSVTPTSDIITVNQHHSFVELPDNNYQTRAFDPRSGYFGLSYFDFAAPVNEPIEKRLIVRHRLEKKNPEKSLSEPVEPIIYYLDRGTPEPIRSALIDGAKWWNQAFEAIGYKDAFQVKLLPENVDIMDVRYNVIQWVHRSTRGWSYGDAVVDPRTGEIIKGHVSLGSLRVRQDYLIAEGLLAPYKAGIPVSEEMEKMALARLRQLSAHEVGHTLGLAHSYTSSSEDFASVMDYPHPYVKITDGKLDISEAYDDKIGAWDNVSIAYGYQDFPDGVDEAKELESILLKALANDLSFLSDQDARPKGGAHPRAHLWDNGTDAAKELERVMKVREIALSAFGENNITLGTPMALIEEKLVPIYFFHRYQVEAAVKIVGGLGYTYALRGDNQVPTTWINSNKQLGALNGLLETIAPKALALPTGLIDKIPPLPLGYSRTREVIKPKTSVTFDPFSYAEAATQMVFELILDPARVTRISQNVSINPEQPSLEKVLDKMILSTIKSDIYTDEYYGHLQRLVNHILLENLMRTAANQQVSFEARAIINYKLTEIESWLKSTSREVDNTLWNAHYIFEANAIQKYLDDPEKFNPEKIMAPPPGSPIGGGMHCGF